MKYDFSLDINNPNSLSIILKQIKPYSTVLEFGPAMGRMTKYMKEVLNCKVYIVELDEEGYNCASQYAVDGYLGNAESGVWFEYFQDLRFDYITFADVIEHLKNPDEVITWSRSLLNENGQVLISVPNVANNAIIIDLMNNKFNYKSIGLLDNTHIKFFTYYTLLELLEKCNMKVLEENATYAQPNETEFLNSYYMVPTSLGEALKGKEYGAVYQFVFTCVRKEDFLRNKEKFTQIKNIKKQIPVDEFKIYINNGEGLNENNTISRAIFMGINDIQYDISLFNVMNEIRLDFTEDPCIVKIESLSLGDITIDINSLEGNYTYHINNFYIFLQRDPYINIVGLTDIDNLRVLFQIEKLYENNLEKSYNAEMFNAYINFRNENNIYSNIIKERDMLLEKQIKDIDDLFNNFNNINNSHKMLEKLNDSYKLEIVNKEHELTNIKKEADKRNIELKVANNIILNNENEINFLNDKIAELESSKLKKLKKRIQSKIRKNSKY